MATVNGKELVCKKDWNFEVYPRATYVGIIDGMHQWNTEDGKPYLRGTVENPSFSGFTVGAKYEFKEVNQKTTK